MEWNGMEGMDSMEWRKMEWTMDNRMEIERAPPKMEYRKKEWNGME